MTRCGSLLALALMGCQAPPRSSSYFEEHPREAERIVADCRTGARRGQECDTAAAGLAAIAAQKRLDLFRKGFE